MNLLEYKEQYPQFGDVDDEILSDAIYKKEFEGKVNRLDFDKQWNPASKASINRVVDHFSTKYGVNSDIIKSIIQVESRYNRNAIGKSEDRGLMQITPIAEKELRNKGFPITDIFDVHQNIEGGVRLYRQYLDRFGGDNNIATVAYNTGPTEVAQMLREDKELPKKYLSEISDVLRSFQASKPQVDQTVPTKQLSQQSAAISPVIESQHPQQSFGEGFMQTAKDIGQVTPILDLFQNTAYNMLITFPATMGAFVGGGITEHGWNTNKAREAYHGATKFLHKEPYTASGKRLSQAAFGNLDQWAVKAGEFIVDKTGSPLAGAITYAAGAVLPWILGGSLLRPMKTKGNINRVKSETVVTLTKSDIIDGFKESVQRKDFKSAESFKKALDNMDYTFTDKIKTEKVQDLMSKKELAIYEPEVIAEPFEIKYGTSIKQEGIISVKPFETKVGTKEARIIEGTKEPLVQSTEFKATSSIKEIRKDIERVDSTKIDEIVKASKDEYYIDIGIEKEMFTQDTQGAVAQVKAEQLLNPKITSKSIGSKAKSKELVYTERIGADGSPEFLVRDKFGNEYSFRDLKSTNDFITQPIDSFAAAEKAYYKAQYDAFQRAPEIGKQFAVEKAGRVEPTHKKFIDNDATRKMIDDAVSIKEDEAIPVVNLPKATKALALAKIEYGDILPNRFEGEPWITQYFMPYRHAIRDISFRRKIDFGQHYNKIDRNMPVESKSVARYQNWKNRTLKGLNLESRKRISKFMETEGVSENLTYQQVKKTIDSNKTLFHQLGALTKKEFRAAQQVRKIFNEAGKEYGVDINAVDRYVHRMLTRGMKTFDEAIASKIMPEEFRWAADMERIGNLYPRETDISKIVDGYVRGGARKKYIGPHLDALSKAINRATKDKSITSPEQKILEQYIAEVRGWQTGTDVLLENMTVSLARFLNKTPPFRWSKKYPNIEYRKEMVTEKGQKAVPRLVPTGEAHPGFFETYNILNRLISLEINLTSAGALGLRPVLVIRNSLQALKGLPIVGEFRLVQGIKKAHSAEGMTLAKSRGWLMDNYLPIGGDVTLVKGLASKLARVGLHHFKKRDNFNRAANGFAMEFKVLANGEKFLKNIKGVTDTKTIHKQMNKFVVDTGCDFFHKAVIQNEFIPLAKAKKIPELAERMGYHMAVETQWNYRRANAAYWMQGKAGRLGGQFGSWAHNEWQYQKALLTRGSKKNIAKRIARWTAYNYAIKTIGEEVFGVDIRKWVFWHPVFWAGGPTLSAFMAAGKLAQGIAAGDNYAIGVGKNTIKNYAKINIPFSLALLKLIEAPEEHRKEDKIKVGLGFTPTYED